MDSWTTIAPLYDRIDTYVRYARRFVLDPTEGEDVCHDAFMKLKARLDGGEKVKNPDALVRRIVRDLARDRNRRTDTVRDTTPHLARLTEARQEATADVAMFNVAFNDALARLGSHERAAFILCELRGLTQAQAAAEMQVSQQAVSNYYERARRSLARELA